jgi:NAD-dependent deacetylase
MSPTISAELVSRLAGADAVVVFTGAGMSAESGIPTFRGADGIWKKFKPEELANVNAFTRNPALVWEWYAYRKRIVAETLPNPGHRALVRMEELVPRFAIITQNIDNLHRRAGSRTVHELHGNIERNYCMQCGKPCADADVVTENGIPTCGSCGGLIRPDVVWFGEMLPEDTWEASVRAAEGADVFLSVGTSAVVYPAASLPVAAKRAGAYLVEINPEQTLLTSQADQFLQGPSGEILPAVAELMAQKRGSRWPDGGRL